MKVVIDLSVQPDCTWAISLQHVYIETGNKYTGSAAV